MKYFYAEIKKPRSEIMTKGGVRTKCLWVLHEERLVFLFFGCGSRNPYFLHPFWGSGCNMGLRGIGKHMRLREGGIVLVTSPDCDHD